MLNVKMDLSWLERLQKVLTKLDGRKTWEFGGPTDPDLSGVDGEALSREAIQELMGNEAAQKAFLSRNSFSYGSRLAKCQITATSTG